MAVDSPVQAVPGPTGGEGPAASTPPRVSIVLPVLNEARHLLEVIPTLPAVDQVVVVDGGSVDGSAEVARSLLPGVEVVQQTRRGKGNALLCGFAATTGDIVVTFPADGSADPADIGSLVDSLLAGADLARGSRFVPGGRDGLTRVRRLGLRSLGRWAGGRLHATCTDLGHDVGALWSDVLEELALPDPAPARAGRARSRRLPLGDGAEIEALIQCRAALTGLAVTEIPSRQRRIRGTGTRHAVRDGLRLLRTVHAERRRARRVERGLPAAAPRPQAHGERPVVSTADKIA